MREAGSRPIITNSVYSYLNSFWNQYCGGVTIGTVLFIYLFIYLFLLVLFEEVIEVDCWVSASDVSAD